MAVFCRNFIHFFFCFDVCVFAVPEKNKKQKQKQTTSIYPTADLQQQLLWRAAAVGELLQESCRRGGPPGFARSVFSQLLAPSHTVRADVCPEGWSVTMLAPTIEPYREQEGSIGPASACYYEALIIRKSGPGGPSLNKKLARGLTQKVPGIAV